MNVPKNLTQVIARTRYAVADATLLASDAYWDGRNWERSGRNTFLYRTPRSLFFTVQMSQWQGEPYTRLTACDVDEAADLWETLGVQELPFEDAFPTLTLQPA